MAQKAIREHRAKCLPLLKVRRKICSGKQCHFGGTETDRFLAKGLCWLSSTRVVVNRTSLLKEGKNRFICLMPLGEARRWFGTHENRITVDDVTGILDHLS